MQNIKEAASEFLAKKRVAVTGVSRHPKSHGSNTVYKRLRERREPERGRGRGRSRLQGSEIDPRWRRRCGDRDQAGVRRGHDARVRRARHQARVDALGGGATSVSDTAADYGRRHGITVIDGGCPLMFSPTSDFGHKVMRVVLSRRVPKQV
jgi:uncharacterized protein